MVHCERVLVTSPRNASYPQLTERWYSEILLLIVRNVFSHRSKAVNGDEVLHLTAEAYLLENISKL